MSTSGPEKPLVSVGFPIFNEETGLRAALDSILAQDYEHLEVIVCDNASTDATLEIARDYASRDARIAVHDSDSNRGARFNFNRCFELASGRYFTWASGHDTRLPQAIRKSVEALEDDPRLVLCYPRTQWRLLDGTLDPDVYDTFETHGLPPARRLRKTIEELMRCNAIHGVIRASALAQTRLFSRCWGADNVLLAELSLLGDFHQLDETLFIRTENRLPEQWHQWRDRVIEMVGVRRPLARALPFTVEGFEHVRGAWYVSEGTAKVTNARVAAFSFTHRYWSWLEAEWHLTRPARTARAVLKSAAKRYPMHSESCPSSRATAVLPGRTIARTPTETLGSVDRVTFDGVICILEGWAIGGDGTPLTAHAINIGDVRVGRASLRRTSRPDVGAAFAGAVDNCGFRATFSLLDTQPEHLAGSTVTVDFGDAQLTAEWPNALAVCARSTTRRR